MLPHIPVRDLDPDAEAMLRVKNGDAEAFSELVNRYRPALMHLLFRMVHNHAICEELTQETFLRVYRARERYEPTARFRAWVFRIAGNLALNWIRSHGHEASEEPIGEREQGAPLQIADERANTEMWLLSRFRNREIHDAISGLPPNQRKILLLHKIEGVDCIGIAGMLGCSHQAVRSTLFRAYTTLRVRLAHLER